MKPKWSVVAVVPHGDLLLAIARAFNARDVNLPGGNAVRTDKEPSDTLRRVVLEKTGVHVVNYTKMDNFEGLFGQDVYSYFVTNWNGKPRSSDAGKVFWAKPHQLALPNATFADTNVALLRRLLRIT